MHHNVWGAYSIFVLSVAVEFCRSSFSGAIGALSVFGDIFVQRVRWLMNFA